MRVTLSPTVQTFGSDIASERIPAVASGDDSGEPSRPPAIPALLAQQVDADAALAPFLAPYQEAELDPALQAWLAPVASEPSPRGPKQDLGVDLRKNNETGQHFLQTLFGGESPDAVKLPGACDGADPFCAMLPPPPGRPLAPAPSVDRAVLERSAHAALAAEPARTGVQLRMVIDVAGADICGVSPGGALELRFDPRFDSCDPVYVALDQAAAVELARRILNLVGQPSNPTAYGAGRFHVEG